MLSPERIIADLDAALLASGEDVILRRKSNSGNADVGCRARVRGVNAQKVVGTVTQNDLSVVMSPTEILAGGWPGGAPPAPGAVDPRLPRTNDFMVVKGRERQVKFSDPIYVAGQWVRCNLIVAG
ncbi:hypothetical protein [Rhizobium lentis]|uniref:Uncharacterized protein n=1 Tax=Rhizobium lentis TaxID=1138194 RepID=A0A7W8UMK2_9HYPH|nr:hypothetical protein [Rhizobium lentis]MBB4574392.1 hypothetical protein [Rhizobium lentis]MBB5550318.1 hypothetical protein [Rhizobium lentis]MBB5560653.1 hypothetical protein [Rhizobium lentis]MBB5567238.1 hypothetical protein [Rhizobium lentis]